MVYEDSINSMTPNLEMPSRNNENTPLLQLSRDNNIEEPTNTEVKASAVFIPRRYVVFLVFICYFLAGGIFAHACPQYTQHIMKEKYKNVENNSSALRRNGSICYLNKTDPAFKIFTHIQRDTAKWSMAYPIASKLPALVTNLIWSSYSDVVGRKIVFIICLSGATARMFLFTFVVGFDLNLGFIVFGSVIDGLTGSFTTLFSVMFSYVSDITTPGKQRTIVIIMSELFRSISITVSAVGSGYIISRAGFLTTALSCVVIEVTGLLIAVCLLPETLRNHRNNGIAVQTTTEKRTSGMKRMLNIISGTFMFYLRGNSGSQRLRYILLILGFLFYGVAGMNRASIETLYLLGRPFCWTATKIGWFHAIKTAVSAVCAMSITYGFRKHISDDAIATFSVTLVGVSYIVEGVANNEYVLYLVSILAAMSTLPIPMVRSLMSSLTPQNKQGALNAGIGFVEGLCTLVGSVGSNSIYSGTMTIYNGFVFLLMSLVTFISAAILSAFMIVNRRKKMLPGNKYTDEKYDTELVLLNSNKSDFLLNSL